MKDSYTAGETAAEGWVQGMGEVMEGKSSRTMRVRKVVKPCPGCKADLADFVKGASINRQDAAAFFPAQVSIHVPLGLSDAV